MPIPNSANDSPHGSMPNRLTYRCSTVETGHSHWRLRHEGACWLGIGLLAALVGWWKGFSLVLLLAYVMVALWLVQLGLLWRRRRGWAASIRPLPPLFAGEQRTGLITVTNLNGTTAAAVIDVQIGKQTLRWFLAAVQAGHKCELSWTGLPRQRGYWEITLHIEESDVFGWFERRQAIPLGQAVILPAIGHIETARCRRWLERMTATGEATTPQARRRVVLEPAEVRGVRPYQPGDPLRAIHWRSTARRRRCMVREYDIACGLPLLLTLRPARTAKSYVDSDERWESALSFAATLAYHWPQISRMPLLLSVATDPPVLITIPATGRGLRFLLRPLADSRLAPSEPHCWPSRLGRCLHLVVTTESGPTTDVTALPFVPPRQILIPITIENLPNWYAPPAHLAETEADRPC